MLVFRRRAIEINEPGPVDLDSIVGHIYRYIQRDQPINPMVAYEIAVEIVMRMVTYEIAHAVIDREILVRVDRLDGLIDSVTKMNRHVNAIKYFFYASLGVSLVWAIFIIF